MNSSEAMLTAMFVLMLILHVVMTFRLHFMNKQVSLVRRLFHMNEESLQSHKQIFTLLRLRMEQIEKSSQATQLFNARSVLDKSDHDSN